MSQYSRRQEDRMMEKLKAIGFEIVEDTARTTVRKGDKVARHIDTGLLLTIDHKSTRGAKSNRVEKQWFDKIEQERVKGSIPAITISFYNNQKIYICFDIDWLQGVMY